MLEIKIKDGIPCIVVPKGIIGFKDELINEIKEYYTKTPDFTDFQNLKENNHLKDILNELKKKFNEK